MSKAKRTLTPWIISKQGNVLDSSGDTIAYVSGGYHAGLERKANARANARLIAAAPEMLEVLQYAQKWFEAHAPLAYCIDGKPREIPMLICIKKAIAKARGENA